MGRAWASRRGDTLDPTNPVETTVPLRNAYDKYATTNPVERRLMEGFLDALDAALAPLHPGTVLEVGAGEGEITTRVIRRWPEATVLAADLPDTTTAAHWAGRDLVGRGLFADARRLPLPDRSVELVLAIEVLEHVADPAAALAELHRVCAGEVVLSVPREPIWRAANLARGKYLRDLGNTPGHVNHWSSGAFTRLVDRHFDIRFVARPFPWTVLRASRR